jgi:putative molybdopterin biosynthesis protein
MKPLAHLPDLEPLEVLGDPRRLRMLRMLMARPMTITQIGEVFDQHAAWVRHHIKLLEKAGLIELVQARVTKGYIEKFYAANARTFMIQNLILPESDQPLLVISGSHDLALEHLANALKPHLQLITLPVGSLDGLVNLRQGFSHCAGAHLLDASGEYNTPYVRHLFPDRPVTLITLAYRTQGLLVAPGNPKGIHALADLTRKGIAFINRNPGSGTRVWFDRELQRIGLPASAIRGYESFVHTHSQAAQTIVNRIADVTLGIQAAAHEYGLGFIPLFDERYDLVIPNEQLKPLHPLLDTLQTKAFRKEVETLTGYSTTHSGEQIYL